MRTKFEQAQEKFLATVDHLKSELSAIRAGRANTSMFDGIMVDAYGQKMPINQLANINVVDATLVTIQPWDKSTIEFISKAIQQSDMGINPSVDGELIRLPLPALTEERRVEYVKLMKKKVEEGRIAVRQVRKDILVGLDMDKEDKEITEDQHASMSKQLQVIVDDANDKIEELSKQKEEELMHV